MRRNSENAVEKKRSIERVSGIKGTTRKSTEPTTLRSKGWSQHPFPNDVIFAGVLLSFLFSKYTVMEEMPLLYFG